jgi:FkbM family methyltransferase
LEIKKPVYTNKKFFDCGTHMFQGFRSFSEMYNIDSKWKCYCFEANPITYIQSLKILKGLLNEGYQIDHFNSAVSDNNLPVKINCALDGNEFTNQGSNILESPPDKDSVYGGSFNYKTEDYHVKGIDFSKFLKSNVTENDFVVIKMDIEGSEFSVIDSLIATGSFKLINELYVEFHERFFSDVNHYTDKKNYYKKFFEDNGVTIKEWI